MPTPADETSERRRTWNDLAQRLPGNFTILLCALLAFVLLPPFFATEKGDQLIIPLLLSIVAPLTLRAFTESRRQFLVGLALAIPSLAGRWVIMFTANRLVLICFAVAWILFLGLAVSFILRLILTSRRITYDTISGAICGYLLFGVMCSFIYGLIEIFYPGSFREVGQIIEIQGTARHVRQEMMRFIYFSLVTLSTLGYGDIAPVSAPARAVASVEAISGQFYIAVLIARLVSLHSLHWGGE